ncbi:MmcQ/YjbR family DNA-binding protein [Granulicella arctica]|uniref:MmcQ/YjbR family DNA-binding protein n=1 Tax=Granulicella arctica TaxID=940613 RepID=UPI0021DFDE94|nr:MmcQ/YjbR family DNA-binding protein [Granulicella arctica]
MDAERVRAFLLKLPHVVETLQWGDNLVFWVGDKAIGGKMFVLANLEADSKGVISYSAGPTRFAELVEIEGLFPAPYLARIHWIAAHRWDVFRPKEWEHELRGAYDITLGKLPPKTRKILALPPEEQQKLIAARRALLDSKQPRA